MIELKNIEFKLEKKKKMKGNYIEGPFYPYKKKKKKKNWRDLAEIEVDRYEDAWEHCCTALKRRNVRGTSNNEQ